MFDNLPEMISSNSLEWQEYFNVVNATLVVVVVIVVTIQADQPSLMTPTPSTSHQFSMFQKLILWKIIKPSQVSSGLCELILYHVGNRLIRSSSVIYLMFLVTSIAAPSPLLLISD